MKKRTEGTDHKKNKSLINRCFLTRGGSRRILSIGVSAFLFVSTFLASILQTETIVYADNVKTITGLCTGAIGNPNSGAGGWSYVYYGINPVKYRVLSKSTTAFNANATMLLDCDSTIINKRFDDASNDWKESEICKWLNQETVGGFYCDSFTAQEKAAIVASTKMNFTNDGPGRDDLDPQNLSGEYVFLLDAKEATNMAYGYAEDYQNSATRGKSGTDNNWWLRSPLHILDDHAGNVNTSGYINSGYVDTGSLGVSPAFNLNLSSVIFSSEVSDGYKLTVKDENMTIAKTDGSDVTRAGKVVTVPYTITGGNPTQVSVLITDDEYSPGTVAKDGNGYSYQKLNVTTWGTSGTGTFTIPDSYADETCGTDYYAYILAEDVNTDPATATDYASVPASIMIPSASAEKVATPTHDSDDDDHEEHKPASWELNPNEKQQLSIIFTGTPEGTCVGYQEQGAAAKAVFAAATPRGWSEAFEFNLLNKYRQPEMTLKKGTFTLTIPSEYRKAGRQFALIALTKGGQTILLPDTDTNPNTVTATINVEGYAFALIYKD